MKNASYAFALVFLALGMVSRPAHAATLTATLSVSATVVSSCQISAPATAFGTYTARRASAASPASVACTSPTPYNVSLSSGQAHSATETTQISAGPTADLLGPALLPASTHAVNWERMAGAYAVAAPGSGSLQPHAVSGPSTGAQQVAPGAYADSVTITITY